MYLVCHIDIGPVLCTSFFWGIRCSELATFLMAQAVFSTPYSHHLLPQVTRFYNEVVRDMHQLRRVRAWSVNGADKPVAIKKGQVVVAWFRSDAGEGLEYFRLLGIVEAQLSGAEAEAAAAKAAADEAAMASNSNGSTAGGSNDDGSSSSSSAPTDYWRVVYDNGEVDICSTQEVEERALPVVAGR